MLASLARALRLTSDERDYLFRVAGHTAPVRVSAPAHVPPALLRVLDRLDDTPAVIISDLGETLVQNRMAAALLGDNTGYTGLARSGIYRWFTDPAERLLYPAGRPRPPEPGPRLQPARRSREDGTEVPGRRDRAGPAEDERRVRRAVGAPRGRPPLRGPQGAHPPRARRHRTGLPGAVHRGPVTGAARAHRAAAHRGPRETPTARGARPAGLRPTAASPPRSPAHAPPGPPALSRRRSLAPSTRWGGPLAPSAASNVVVGAIHPVGAGRWLRPRARGGGRPASRAGRGPGTRRPRRSRRASPSARRPGRRARSRARPRRTSS